MSKINWKVAAIGGAAIGAAVGGFSLAGADSNDSQPVRDVDLQSYQDDIRSLSSPVEVTTTVAPTTTQAQAPARAAIDSPDSPDTPVAPRQAPAPAPSYDSPASPASPDSPVQPADWDSVDSVDSWSAASAASS